MTDGRATFGRNMIFSNFAKVTRDNVLDILGSALSYHNANARDIEYLYKYYRGDQPILYRTKSVREDILNKIVENRANEIVSFKVGYLMGEPIQYVNRTGNETAGKYINALNEYVFTEDKAARDKELAEWFMICGTAYRIVLPNKEAEDGDSPFHIYTLDPRYAFVVYWSGLGNKPLMGVKFVTNEDNDIVYSVYTEDTYYEIVNDEIVAEQPHTMGGVPIIEYPANTTRLGAFEIVLPLLDAINEVASNRIDGVEQFIQSLLMFKGVDIEENDFIHLKELGGIKVPPDGDVKYLIQELNQSSTQTLVDSMYQTVLTICGMPNRNGGTSTSDTGSAVIMRDGWSAAEARAKDTELMFKQSENKFLRIALRIMNAVEKTELRLSEVEIRFTRRNYENIQEKSQVLVTMLSNSKIHPRLAFEHSGMFVDPELAYSQSMDYYEEQQAKMERELTESPVTEETPDV